jgi:hypothetical protein
VTLLISGLISPSSELLGGESFETYPIRPPLFTTGPSWTCQDVADERCDSGGQELLEHVPILIPHDKHNDILACREPEEARDCASVGERVE